MVTQVSLGSPNQASNPIKPLKSKVNPEYDFDNQRYVVHLINTGDALGGHLVILVEGLKNDGSLFVRQFDIRARERTETTQDTLQSTLGNTQGYISAILTHKQYRPGFNYSQKSHSPQPWYATPEAVKRMRTSIKDKQRQLNDALDENGKLKEGKEPPFKWQMAGSRRWWGLGGNGGDNCVTWSQRELIEANIMKPEEAAKKIDLVKAPPEAHARKAAEQQSQTQSP